MLEFRFSPISYNIQNKKGAGKALSIPLVNKHWNFPNQLRVKRCKKTKIMETMTVSEISIYSKKKKNKYKTTINNKKHT